MRTNAASCLWFFDYYPFGLTIAGISSKAAGKMDNKYKFNGIEENSDFDINTFDAFYRTNDPQIGRWWQIDPKAESFFGLTSYNSMGNNPIVFNDPEEIFLPKNPKNL